MSTSENPIMFADLWECHMGKKARIGPYVALDLCSGGKIHSLPQFGNDPDTMVTEGVKCSVCERLLDWHAFDHNHPLLQPVVARVSGIKMQWMEVIVDREGYLSWTLCLYILEKYNDDRDALQQLRPGALALIKPTRYHCGFRVLGPYRFDWAQYNNYPLHDVIKRVISALVPDHPA